MSKHTPIGATFADWLEEYGAGSLNESVSFVLSAPTLDERIASIIGEIAGHLTEATGIEPLWVP